MMNAESSGAPVPDPQSLFAAFLERYHVGEAGLDELCREHPEHAARFRGWWARLADAGEVGSHAAAAVSMDSRVDAGGAPSGTGPLSRALETIGPYRILEVLGRGGQGTVYLALDSRLRRKVAVKVLTQLEPVSERQLARFRREAEVASRIDHSGLCAVFDVGVEEAVPYIAMRYVEGETLATKLARERAGPRDGGENRMEVIRLFERCAQALHAAHQAGVIHRDIKPGNIMVTPSGEPVILDFGLARLMETDLPSLTSTGEVFGTPSYMSPEQIAPGGAPLDHRTDVFSLGVTLYECLTLARPFDAPTREGLYRALLLDEPADPVSFNAAISKDLKTVLLTAIEKDPDRRYRTALDFAEDLRRIREHEPIRARPAGPMLRLARWAERKPALAASLALAFLSLAAGLVLTGTFLAKSRTMTTKLAQRDADYRRMADVSRIKALEGEVDSLFPATPESVGPMIDWLGRADLLRARLPVHESRLGELRRRAESRPASEVEGSKWVIEDPEEQFEHDTLDRHVRNLERFFHARSGPYARVRDSLEFARTVRQRTIVDAALAWSEAIASIADRARCPKYDGLGISPQLGLVPIARNPRSGLWEFADVQTGDVPIVRADGGLVMTEASALVLVLIPAGTFQMGAVPPTDTRPVGSPGADSRAQRVEAPIHEVELGPFFLSKYEMTQGQWLRFARENPARYKAGLRNGDTECSLLNPVESASFDECSRTLAALGLVLPTEAQWEYAARAGTTTVFWTGDDVRSLEGAANLLDSRAYRVQQTVREHEAWLDDGHEGTAAVGSLRANDFGLHDVAGNVFEFCRDRLRPYRYPVAGREGERTCPGHEYSQQRIMRGGSYQALADLARSAARYAVNPEERSFEIGVRPARRLDGPR